MGFQGTIFVPRVKFLLLPPLIFSNSHGSVFFVPRWTPLAGSILPNKKQIVPSIFPWGAFFPGVVPNFFIARPPNFYCLDLGEFPPKKTTFVAISNGGKKKP